MNKKLLILLFIIWATSLVAQTGSPPGIESVHWQRISFQEKMQQRISDTLLTLISRQQFVLNIAIDADEVPPFTSLAPPAPAKKKVPKVNDLKKNKEIKEDAIVFSKLGISAPLFEDETEVFPPAIDTVGTYAKLAEHYDFFKYLKRVVVEVSLDQDLLPEQKNSIKKMLKSLNLQFGKIKLEIVFKDIVVKKPTFNSNRELIDTLGKFSSLLGILLFGLIAAFITLKISRQFSSLLQTQMEALIQAMGNMSPNKNSGNDEKKNSNSVSGVVGTSALSSVGSANGQEVDGVERFKLLIQRNINDAVFLIKKWINLKSEMDVKALVMLAHHLENEELKQVFEHLSIHDRQVWKKYLDNDFPHEQQKMIANYINKQITENVIVPPIISDAELSDVLSNLSSEEFVDICRNDITSGAILLNTVESRRIISVLGTLGDEQSKKIINYSLTLTEARISESMDQFKQKMMSYKKSRRRSPFMDKMLELISIASPDQETMLFASYLNFADRESVENVALSNFPTQLFDHISDDVYRAAIKLLSGDLRGALFYAMDEQKREKFSNIVAPVGVRARDMLEFDIEKIAMNKQLEKNAKEEAEANWQSFVQVVRRVIRNDEEQMNLLRPKVQEWLNQIASQEAPVLEESAAA